MADLSGVRTLSGVLILTSILSAGCSRSPESNHAASPPAAAGQEIRIGYFANLSHTQALLGMASGEFEQAVAPAKVTGRVFNAGPSLIEALFAGEVDIGFVGPGPVINAHARTKGKAIRVIAGAAANGVVVVVRPGAGIEKFEDLKNKRIATPQLGNTQDISARHFLSTALGQTDLENVVPIANSEQLSLMSRGRIDAAWTPEPWGARMVAEAGGRILLEEKDLWPEHEVGLTLVVSTPAFLMAHRDLALRVLAVSRSWTARLSADPQKYVPQLAAALSKLTGKQLSPQLLGAAISRIRFTDDILEDTLRTMAQWSYELKFLKDQIDLQGLVDSSLLQELQAGPSGAAEAGV